MSEAASGVEHTAPALPARWHRRVLALAFPIVLANLTQPILGAVDTAVAGHLDGAAYLGGVALGGLFFNFVFWGFGFCAWARPASSHRRTVRATTRHCGDRRRARHYCSRPRSAPQYSPLQVPLIDYALRAIGGSDAVQRNARLYCHARIWAAIRN